MADDASHEVVDAIVNIFNTIPPSRLSDDGGKIGKVGLGKHLEDEGMDTGDENPRCQ